MTHQQTIAATVTAHVIRRSQVRQEIANLQAELGEIEQQIEALVLPQMQTPLYIVPAMQPDAAMLYTVTQA